MKKFNFLWCVCLNFTLVSFIDNHRSHQCGQMFIVHVCIKLEQKYAIFHIWLCSIQIATRQMIHSVSPATGLHYLELNWNHPKFLPERYQLKFICTMKYIFKYKNDNENYTLEGTKSLTSNGTSARISNLRPGTVYKVSLLAVYNPASIDSGIAITRTTLNEYISKRNFGLKEFKITISYCLCLQDFIQSHSKCGEYNEV